MADPAPADGGAESVPLEKESAEEETHPDREPRPFDGSNQMDLDDAINTPAPFEDVSDLSEIEEEALPDKGKGDQPGDKKGSGHPGPPPTTLRVPFPPPPFASKPGLAFPV
jgi:hypothetical protein